MILTFREARVAARAGHPVRMVGWADRWLVYVPAAKWFLVSVDPITGAEQTRHIIEMAPECSPAWWTGKWTTDPVPRGGSMGELLTVFPWVLPLTIEWRALVDGSDYIHILDGDLWMTHRNWNPPLNVQIKVGDGDWVSTTSAELGELWGYDQVTFEHLSGRGSAAVVEAWDGNGLVVLVDDDAAGGADNYHFRLVFRWSGTATPTKPPPRYTGAVRYRWLDGAGDDLDIGVRLMLPPFEEGDGTSDVGYGWGDASGPSERPYLRWTGDSASTGERGEEVAVDFGSLQRDNPGLDRVRLELRGGWYSGGGTGIVEISFDLWAGGVLQIDEGGIVSNSIGDPVSTASASEILDDYDLVGVFEVDLTSGEVYIV